MYALNYVDRVYGRPLRYLACLALRQAGRSMTLPELVEAIQSQGFNIAGSANKVVADALRWEVRKGRVVRAGRGRYRFGQMPRSTEWWMKNQIAAIRSATFAQTLASHHDFALTEIDCVARAARRGSPIMATIERVEKGAGAICAEILATLPTWFGIPEANAEYVAAADAHTTFVAFDDDSAVGLTTVTRFGEFSGEVHLMAVVPELHRRGVGRQMLEAAEGWLREQQVEYLQVKTLSASASDEGYALTRAFYRAMGFRELEEFSELWDPSNPALQLIKRL